MPKDLRQDRIVGRIAIVDVSHLAYEYNFGAIGSLLVEAGHEVLAVYDGAEPPRNQRVKHSRCNWYGTGVTEMERFKPDYVLVFNGSHPHRYAATRLFEKRWKVVYAENGWLPQGDNIYLDSLGVNSRSSIAQAHFDPPDTPEGRKDDESTARFLRKMFAPKKLKIALPKDYILVPLQLENDTSIVQDSPYFKSMRSFVNYVAWHFNDHPILVKPHPKDSTNWNIGGVTIIDKTIPMNDLVPDAKLVIGINSTSLIEALVHHKPVVALGRNVASGKGAYVGEADEMFHGVARAVLGREPDKVRINAVLRFLFNKQFPRKNPPPRILDFFL